MTDKQQPEQPSSEIPMDRERIEANMRQAKGKKGLVIVHTGNGKGKSTAAFGMMTRAWGRGMRVAVIQFIKSDSAFGEQRAAEKMDIEWISSGDGFTWTSDDIDETAALARHGWEQAQQRITSGKFDMVILDEFTYAMNYKWVDTDEVLTWIADHKPEMLHLVITGRDADPKLVESADLVTEMVEVKHPYTEQGIRAQAGVEF